MSHPLYPSRQKAAEDPKLVMSDHLPIYSEIDLGDEDKLKILSMNTMGHVSAPKFSGFGYEESDDDDNNQAVERDKRIVETFRQANKKHALDIIHLQETNISTQLLAETLGDDWEIIEIPGAGMITCYNKARLKGEPPRWDGDNKIISVKVRLKDKNKTHDAHNVWSNFTHHPHQQEAIYRKILKESIQNGADSSSLTGDSNSRAAPIPNNPENKKEQNITTGIIPLKFVHEDPVLGPVLHQHFKETNTFYLLAVGDDFDPDNYNPDEKNPTIIKKGDDYYMYGNYCGTDWKVTPLWCMEPMKVIAADAFAPISGDFTKELTPADPNKITLEMCRVMIQGNGTPSPAHMPTLLFSDMPDCVFSLTNQANAQIKQETTRILTNEGDFYEAPEQPELAQEEQSIAQKLLDTGHKALMCLDSYYETAELIDGCTVFAYEERLRELTLTQDLYVRPTANHLNQRGISISFNEHSFLYEKLKTTLAADESIQFAERTDSYHARKTYKSIFVPEEKIENFHSNLRTALKNGEFAALHDQRKQVLKTIHEQIEKLSKPSPFANKILREGKKSALESLRDQLLAVTLDQKMGCRILKTYTEPTRDRLESFYSTYGLSKNEAAYVLYDNKLYYINSEIWRNRVCQVVSEDTKELVEHLNPSFQKKTLTDDDLSFITEKTGSAHLTKTAIDRYDDVIDAWKKADSTCGKVEGIFRKRTTRLKNEQLIQTQTKFFHSKKTNTEIKVTDVVDIIAERKNNRIKI